MKITLHPVRRDERLMLSREGDALMANGQKLDFSGVPDGAILPQDAITCDWIAGDVTREDGVLTVPMFLPHGPDAPEATRFPQPITLIGDGPVDLPPHTTPEDAT